MRPSDWFEIDPKHLFRKWRLPAVLSAALLLWACSSRSPQALRLDPLPEAELPSEAESAFQLFRYYDDQVAVTKARGAEKNISKVPLRDLQGLRAFWKDRARAALAWTGADLHAQSEQDRRAVLTMRGVMADGASDDSSGSGPVSCDYDPVSLAAEEGVNALKDRIYRCFGKAAESIEFEGEKLSRLEILGLLPLTDDAGKRRKLFMALQDVWKAANGDNGPSSPYRVLVGARVRAWGPGPSPLDRIAADAELDLKNLESWIMAALEQWRAIGPSEPMEPWDFAYNNGRAARELSRRIGTRRRLKELTDEYCRVLLRYPPGALGIHFDLNPRAGKDPVAYATFGKRNYRAGSRWIQGEFWVFASYMTGNLDNLYELLHETGHGIHIAAIRTRPAFEDYPDSNAFSEALADMIGFEVYEPDWQRRFLGREAPKSESIRYKYQSIVQDLLWGLFEIRMYADPDSDPNRVWSDLAHKYLNIRPRPELSWWAVRGQLFSDPGYMLTYAVSYFMSASLRARTKLLRGEAAFTSPPADHYAWLGEQLYRYGLERPATRVLKDYLERALSPEDLYRDLARAAPRAADAARAGRHQLPGRGPSRPVPGYLRTHRPARERAPR